MLQCSNYKTRQAASGRLRASFHATFTKNRAMLLPSREADVICRMAYAAHARDLRNLLSVAAKLRALAAQTQAKGDQVLYLMTAEALEKRAEWLSATLPDEHHDKDGEDDAPWRHRPVDLII
jgi:hypothetical protein